MIQYDKEKYYYDIEAAERVIDFIESYCTHVKVKLSGKPLLLAEFWKEDIIRPAFGIKHIKSKLRRFKTIYVEIGKGNAKSTVGAGIALYLLGADGEKNPEVYSLAGDREQARIIFDTARAMIDQNETLQKYYKTYQYSIVKKNSHGFYKVVSAEGRTKHGFIPYGLIVDELHVQPNRELWDTTTAGAMKIDESITFAFTTAGYDKQSICYEQHQKAEKINAGIIQSDSFLGIIYSAPPADDISKVETWEKANPGLGNIITVDNLRIEYEKILASPSYENTFRRLHLNQWTDQYESWISDLEWEKCNKGGSPDDLLGRECYGGLDLASTRDFNSLCLLFPKDEDTVDVLMWFWIPAERVDERMSQGLINFDVWVKDGYITELPGNAVDHNLILNEIKELSKKYIIKSIAFDRKYAAPIVQGLESEVLMSPFDQSIMNISFPTKQLNIMSAKSQINHFGNPVLRWMMSNVAIYRDPNDNIKVVKHKSPDKVDGVVALIMAVGEWVTFKMKGDGKSIYETRGIISV